MGKWFKKLFFYCTFPSLCCFCCWTDKRLWSMYSWDVWWHRTNVYYRMAAWLVAFFRGHESSLHCKLVSHRCVLANCSVVTVGCWQSSSVSHNDGTLQHFSHIIIFSGPISWIQKCKKIFKLLIKQLHEFFLHPILSIITLAFCQGNQEDANFLAYKNTSSLWDSLCRQSFKDLISNITHRCGKPSKEILHTYESLTLLHLFGFFTLRCIKTNTW